MITILAMGQSNAVGWGNGGAWSFPGTVTVWNCPGNTNTGSVGNAFVAPAFGSPPFTTGHNNLMAHACRYLAAETGQSVRLVLVAMGSQPIAQWSAGGGAMYARMQAVLAAANVTTVDAFLWHQGEADGQILGTYQASWNTLVGKLTSDGYINASTPIVIGEVVISSPAINAVLQAIADADARVNIAAIACFLAGIPHFTGTSLVRAGLEYARELMKLPGPSNVVVAEPNPYPYVTAAGSNSYTPTNGTWCNLLVKAENGQRNLISGGGFKADRLGVWEFNVSGVSYRASLTLGLLDVGGEIIHMVVGGGGSIGTPHYDGSSVIALGKDDRVFLAVLQTSNKIVSVVPAQLSAMINRMTVKYLGRT